MKKLHMKKLGFIIIILGMFFSLNAKYESTVPGGNFQDGSSWNGLKPPASGNDYRTLTIVQDSYISKANDFTGEAGVTVNGTFSVNGDFKSGYGGTTVNGSLIVSETFDGNLTVSSGATVSAKSF